MSRTQKYRKIIFASIVSGCYVYHLVKHTTIASVIYSVLISFVALFFVIAIGGFLMITWLDETGRLATPEQWVENYKKICCDKWIDMVKRTDKCHR